MKKHFPLWGFLLMAVSAATASSQTVTPMLSEGTRAFGFSGQIDDDGDDIGAAFDLSMGLFPYDNLEVGGFGGFSFRGSDRITVTLGGYGEFNNNMGTEWVPYVGARVGAVYWDTPFMDTTYVELRVYGGARYFFVDHAAVGAELVLKAASKKIYNYYEDAFDWGIRFSTRFFY